jgi:hypothetical protein
MTRSRPSPVADPPRYSREDAVKISGLTDGQLQGILDRKIIKLANPPGKGRPRLFSVTDIAKMVAANALARIGVPMRICGSFIGLIEQRVGHLLGGSQPGAWHGRWILYPIEGDESRWAMTMGLQRLEHPAHLQFSYSILEVDRLIAFVMERAALHDAGHPLPDRVSHD